MTGVSATPAIHQLKQHRVPFTEHEYRYEEHGGTAVSSRELGVDEHLVIKTLVMEDDRKQPLIVLMHGDRTCRRRTWRARSAARA
jgi:prolyl-tRNA editing enzyme YbaK/EbsC (Cys-tRNA(Pro) deacylase)